LTGRATRLDTASDLGDFPRTAYDVASDLTAYFRTARISCSVSFVNARSLEPLILSTHSKQGSGRAYIL
ncbi:hypothetical protein BHM03_00039577, partial [Ensete ventricosum]